MRDVGRLTFVLVFVCYRIVCISFFSSFVFSCVSCWMVVLLCVVGFIVYAFMVGRLVRSTIWVYAVRNIAVD